MDPQTSYRYVLVNIEDVVECGVSGGVGERVGIEGEARVCIFDSRARTGVGWYILGTQLSAQRRLEGAYQSYARVIDKSARLGG